MIAPPNAAHHHAQASAVHAELRARTMPARAASAKTGGEIPASGALGKAGISGSQTPGDADSFLNLMNLLFGTVGGNALSLTGAADQDTNNAGTNTKGTNTQGFDTPDAGNPGTEITCAGNGRDNGDRSTRTTESVAGSRLAGNRVGSTWAASNQQIADALIRSLFKTRPGSSLEAATAATQTDGATAASSTLAANTNALPEASGAFSGKEDSGSHPRPLGAPETTTSAEALSHTGRAEADPPILYPSALRSTGTDLAFEARLTARAGASPETALAGRSLQSSRERLPESLSGSLFKNSPVVAAGVSALSQAASESKCLMEADHGSWVAGEGNRQDAGGHDTRGSGQDPNPNAQQNVTADAQSGGNSSSSPTGAAVSVAPAITSGKAGKYDVGRDPAGVANESLRAGAASTSGVTSTADAGSSAQGNTAGAVVPRLVAESPSAPNLTESAARSSVPAPADPPSAFLTPRVHELVVRVNQAGAPAVDLQVTERQGQIHVAVRTPDAGLQTSLRQNLPNLVNALDRAGFRAETSAPHASAGISEVAAASGASETAAGNLNQNSQPGSEGSGSEGNGSQGNGSQGNGSQSNSQGGTSQDQSEFRDGAQGRRPPLQPQPQPQNPHPRQNWRQHTETTL